MFHPKGASDAFVILQETQEFLFIVNYLNENRQVSAIENIDTKSTVDENSRVK